MCTYVCVCVCVCVKAQKVDQQCAAPYICPLPLLPSPLLPSPLLPSPHPSLLQGRVVSTIKHAGISAESIGMQTASISSDTVAIRDRKDERGMFICTYVRMYIHTYVHRWCTQHTSNLFMSGTYVYACMCAHPNN